MVLTAQGVTALRTLSVRRAGKLATLTLDRPDAHNAIDRTMLNELHAVLDAVEADPGIRALVIEGKPGLFCTGLDFMAPSNSGGEIEESARLYFRALRRFTTIPKFIITRIEGRVQAGGVGLVAASDFALASPDATFRLPEVLIGMIPANVLPFLVRRTGTHKAYLLSLTADQLDATRAREIGLIDEVSPALDTAQRRLLIRMDRIPEKTIASLKQYMALMFPLGSDVEDLAVAQVAGLLRDPASATRVRELMHHGLWQSGS
jgi:polyketide biosynthesis enoyl-CoA hydratase PksH